MPFFANLSGPDGEMYQKSVNSLTNELIRSSKLGIKYLITDLGSDRGYGKENGTKQLIKSLEKAIDNYKSAYSKKLDVTILLQNGWGFINTMGSNLAELKEIMNRLPNKGYGVCLDTCHAFIAGYDIRTADGTLEIYLKTCLCLYQPALTAFEPHLGHAFFYAGCHCDSIDYN
jgi:deoxyribonuclease-4